MGTVKRFEDLKVWQEARELNMQVGKALNSETLKNDIPLKNQISRSCGSIMDNIAEGFERNGRKEFIQYLSISKGSSGEVKSQLYRALDRKYISDTQFQGLYSLTNEVAKKLGSLIKYLKISSYSGAKFTEPEEVYQQH